MLFQIISLLLGTFADILAVAFLARLWMQWARAPFRNPVGQTILTFTDWAVLPLRRIIPGLLGIDLASAFAAWLAQIAYFGVILGMTGLVTLAPEGVLAVAWIACIAVLLLFVYVLMGVVIVAALLSWINPYSPFGAVFDALSRPLLQPVRRLLPALGGIDLSPLVVLLLLQVALIVLANLQPARLLLP
jgi:YggT family protein